MNIVEKRNEDVYNLIRQTFLIFNKKFNDEAINIYLTFLNSFSTKDIKEAISRCIVKVKFMPTVSEILKELSNQNSEEDKEKENPSSLKVRDAINKFGYYQTKEAKEFLGEIAWSVVDRYGWKNICDMTHRDLEFCLNSMQKIFDAQAKRQDSNHVNLTLADFSNKKIGILEMTTSKKELKEMVEW